MCLSRTQRVLTHYTATRHWQDVLYNYSSRRRKQLISDHVGYEAFCGIIDNNQALITRSSDGQRLSEECERRPVSSRTNIRKNTTIRNSVLTVVLYTFRHNLFAFTNTILNVLLVAYEAVTDKFFVVCKNIGRCCPIAFLLILPKYFLN